MHRKSGRRKEERADRGGVYRFDRLIRDQSKQFDYRTVDGWAARGFLDFPVLCMRQFDGLEQNRQQGKLFQSCGP